MTAFMYRTEQNHESRHRLVCERVQIVIVRYARLYASNPTTRCRCRGAFAILSIVAGFFLVLSLATLMMPLLTHT